MNSYTRTGTIGYGRIGALILLFAFVGSQLAAQESSRSDSLVRQRRPIIASPGELSGSLSDANGMVRDSIAPDELSGSSNKPRRKQNTISPDSITHSPTRAIVYAAVLPGLGQIYNKKYFKLPIVYAAIGGAGYLIYYNRNQYLQAIDSYNLDPSSQNERILRGWRRNLELSIIVTAGVYGLQIIDAYVDANLFYWDVNTDLSIRVAPDIRPLMLPKQHAMACGVYCNFRF
jgi:hypothetical protein